MMAVRVHEHGGPEVLTADTISAPQPGPGQARMWVSAIGLNFIETYERSGAYKLELPATLGAEAAGTVESVGPGVTTVKPGDRVVSAFAIGAYAEYCLAPADKLATVPAGVDFRTAAAVFLQGLTAHYLSHTTFPLQAGQTCLIHAAAGGTGQLLVQMAKLRGARVIATVSTEAKAAVARECGADEVIIYSQQDFLAETRRLTGGQGVDVVYDSVGKDTFDKSIDCLHPRGYMVLFGQSSGRVPPLDPQVLNAKGSLYLTRPTLKHHVPTREALLARADDIFGWLKTGKLHMRIDKTFALKEAAEAHRYLASRQAMGKVLLLP
ncbi:MAG: quinone oxidoreductase [Anaerolineales bacterium]